MHTNRWAPVLVGVGMVTAALITAGVLLGIVGGATLALAVQDKLRAWWNSLRPSTEHERLLANDVEEAVRRRMQAQAVAEVLPGWGPK